VSQRSKCVSMCMIPNSSSKELSMPLNTGMVTE
jgi:hypothetical protein